MRCKSASSSKAFIDKTHHNTIALNENAEIDSPIQTEQTGIDTCTKTWSYSYQQITIKMGSQRRSLLRFGSHHKEMRWEFNSPVFKNLSRAVGSRNQFGTIKRFQRETQDEDNNTNIVGLLRNRAAHFCEHQTSIDTNILLWTAE